MSKFVVTTALLLSSTIAAAGEAPHRFYITPNAGISTIDISKDDLDETTIGVFEAEGFSILDADSSLDDEGTPWSIVAGWRFNEYFAAEVGYVNLGKAQYEANGTLSFPGAGLLTADVTVDYKAKGPTAALVGILPLGNNFDVHAKAGMLFAKTEGRSTVTLTHPIFGTGTGSDSADGSSKDMFFGAGVAYGFTKQLSATVDYLLYKDVGEDTNVGEADVGSLTLGLTYAF